jgi:hypothetical protein
MAKKITPWSVVVSCLIMALVGVVSLIAGLSSMTLVAPSFTTLPPQETINDPTGILSYMPLPGMLAGLSLALVILGVVFLVFAYLLWQRNEIAWYGSVGLIGISLILNVIAVIFYGASFTTPIIIAIILSAVTLLALYHKCTIRTVNPDIKYNGWSLGG